MTPHEIRDLLYQQLIPALPVPFTSGRIIDHDSHVRMAEYMNDMPIGGVTVWAHTGRGLYLTEEERTEVLTHWRESLPEGIVIAGIGSRVVADHAKSLGADAILCHPPTRFRDLPERERDEAIIEYHSELSRAGLPLILFYLYEAAGGISYSPNVLDKLFKLPNVIGIKIATLDSVMTFQNLARTIKSEHPEKLLITGEDRFLGYSLMMGANAALVGMGAALTMLQSDLMHDFYAQKFESFHFRSQIIDRFAMATFTQPMEGYISRMLYTLAWLGIVSPLAVFDPWGPELTPEDTAYISEFLSSLQTELKR
jgi:4-hydroxy-tetrahydrodipicolinate synthase